MRKLFTILCVMAFSNIFGVDPDCTEENPTEEERLIAINEFANEVMLADPGTLIPMPYSSEVFRVKSHEEHVHQMLTKPMNCMDTIMGTLIQKQNDRCMKGIEGIPDEFMPPVMLDHLGMSGIEQMTEKDLHSMMLFQLAVDYNRFTLEDLGSLQIQSYNQMFVFLRRAEENAKNIYEVNLRTAVELAIVTGIGELFSTSFPKIELMKGVYVGILELGRSSYTDLSEMYNNLEMAIKWAEAGDGYGTAAAQRMGRK